MWTERKLQNRAAKILKLLKLRGVTLDIFLLPHGEMKVLKARFKMKPTEPNVLSFRASNSFPHPEKKKKYLGEIYLNKNILEKSPERGMPLLLHGILHLLGYDHEKKKDAAMMEKWEAEILENLT